MQVKPMRYRLLGIGLAAGLSLLFVRCARRAASTVTCEPVVSGPADSLASIDAGAYRLRMVRTGDTASTEGLLTLERNVDSLRFAATIDGRLDSAVVHPLFGYSDIDLGPIGADAPGSIASRDPMAPGVLVIQWSSGGSPVVTNVMLRFGAAANQRAVTQFDAVYTALRVAQVTEPGFSGTWSSGAGFRDVQGNFCATMVR